MKLIFIAIGQNELKEKLQEMRDIVKNNCIVDKKLKALENTKNNLLNSYNDESTEADIETIVQVNITLY